MKTIALTALVALALAESVSLAATVQYSNYIASGQTDTSWVATSGYNSVLAVNVGGSDTTFGGLNWGGISTSPSGSLLGANGVGITLSNYVYSNGFYSGGPSLLNNAASSGDYLVGRNVYFNGLTIGQDYKAQFIMADTRANSGYATITAYGPNVTGDSTRTRYSYTDGQFLVVTASFTATANTAQFRPGQNWGDAAPTGSFVNGIQLLSAIPEPGVGTLVGLGLGSLLLLRRKR